MIRYKKLGYVELMVTDLDRAAGFYRDIVGLEPAGTGPGGELLFRCSEDPYTVALHRSDKPGFKRGGWMLEDAQQFDALHQRLKKHGVVYEELAPAECAARKLGRATRMVEPNTGATMEFYIPAQAVQPKPFTPTLAKIQRLGHVVWTTPNYDKAIAFFADVLNFAESDSIGEGITFFRAFPNPYHHGIGVARGKRNQFHHLNFMVTEIDDVGRGLARSSPGTSPSCSAPGAIRHRPACFSTSWIRTALPSNTATAWKSSPRKARVGRAGWNRCRSISMPGRPFGILA